MQDQRFRLHWRPFALALEQPLRQARGSINEKRGWLLRLSGASGCVGWGEASPLELDGPQPLAEAIAALGTAPSRADLEALLVQGPCPPCLAFALGAALAEHDALVGGEVEWLPAPPPARLLPAGEAALAALELAVQELADASAEQRPTFKWKVALEADAYERQLLEQLLARLPASARLRLDANGCWDRATAQTWASRLAVEPRLQWLEQPLAPHDLAGLEALAIQVPVALDESLSRVPALRQSWTGWQVRRPSQDGDPRPLLAELAAGRPRLMLSTAFETGIGQRWLHHLAALQGQGPTPVAPGLAQAWQARGPLVSHDPQVVWEAAA